MIYPVNKKKNTGTFKGHCAQQSLMVLQGVRRSSVHRHHLQNDMLPDFIYGI